MKIIRNNVIPCKGFKAINLCGIIFIRKGVEIDFITLQHEAIHTAQMKETLYVFFYVWYVVEWLIRLIIYRDSKRAYKKIGFEREAYSSQTDEDYLLNRKPYNWIKYL
jgi:hypothetical protein